jgi:hypothetical protein
MGVSGINRDASVKHQPNPLIGSVAIFNFG